MCSIFLQFWSLAMLPCIQIPRAPGTACLDLVFLWIPHPLFVLLISTGLQIISLLAKYSISSQVTHGIYISLMFCSLHAPLVLLLMSINFSFIIGTTLSNQYHSFFIPSGTLMTSITLQHNVLELSPQYLSWKDLEVRINS